MTGRVGRVRRRAALAALAAAGVARDARAAGSEVVQFDGPVLELMTEARARFDQRLAGARPGRARRASSTSARFLRRLREDDPTRADRRRAARPAQRRGDRQHLEGRGLLRGGGRPVAAGSAQVTDDEALAIVDARRAPRMAAVGARRATARDRARVYGRAGEPCPRCGDARSARAGQGDDNRTTYWCPGCQR